MDLQADMTFQWRYDQDRKHGYLLKKPNGRPNDRAIEETIERLMLQPPKAKLE
jgi:hypothetical protein